MNKSQIKKLVTLLGFLLFSSQVLATESTFGFDDDEEEQAVKQERANPDPMQQMLNGLIAELPAKQIVNLPLAEEKTFLALQINALSAKAKGQVLMLPGDREHPNWPLGIAPLRQVLPEYGWTTLAIALPIYNNTGLPPRTLGTEPLLSYASLKKNNNVAPKKADTNAEAAFLEIDEDEDEGKEGAAKEVIDPNLALNEYRVLIEARVKAALQHLGNQGKQVLILQGESVYWLQPWLEAGNLSKKSPLILLYVETPAGASSASFAELIKKLGKRPILDIYAGQNSLQTLWAAERKAAYLRAGNSLAAQMAIKVPVSTGDGTDSRWLTQRVEGWLRGL